MPGLQEFIQKLDEGSGAKVLKWVVLGLFVLGVIIAYDMREYKSYSTAEAMDAAQVARNVSEGNGFTTQNIRLFSLYLVSKHRTDHSALIREAHPDLANAPLYPALLGGYMKLAPFNFETQKDEWRYQPEVLIALLNQLFFLLAILMVFRLAKRLFDAPVAWFSAFVMFGSDLLWRFSVSGLSTSFLIVILLGLIECLVRYDDEARQESSQIRKLLLWAGLGGVLLGLGALTRYAFGWFVVPTAIFVLLTSKPQHRIMAVAAFILPFILVLTPWVIRNYQVSGTLFGTAGYAVMQDTVRLPDNLLERLLKPDFEKMHSVDMEDYFRKFLVNSGQILQNDLPKLGGSWLTAFFLVGLMIPFKNPGISRLRLLVVFSLFWMVIIQALGRTHLTADSPDINTENLLVLFAPLVFIFGAALFFILLDHMELPVPELRRLVIGAALVLACFPLIFTFLPPRSYAAAWPPYYPWLNQRAARWVDKNELIMSDIPWAVAWYGQRKAVWLTQDCTEDFFGLNDQLKAVNALYLTQVTMDQRFQSRLMTGPERPWGRFILECLSAGKVPTGFPLKHAWSDLFPEQIYMADWERWKKTGAALKKKRVKSSIYV